MIVNNNDIIESDASHVVAVAHAANVDAALSASKKRPHSGGSKRNLNKTKNSFYSNRFN